MCVTLRQIIAGDPALPALRALNEEAFPPCERIDPAYLIDGLTGMRQELLGICCNGRAVGFLSLVFLDRCAYIGYFAVSAEERGRGIGGAALRLLRERYPDCQIVVDFEAPDPDAPNHQQRLRRRAFYLRNGFHPTGYYQHYMDTEFEIACSADDDYDRSAYERLVREIHARVPDCNPRHYRKDAR